jgi:pimeloyl-ACP methyl ester carboxylesterase
MQYIEVKDTESRTPVKLTYEDVGAGQPVVLIHGWPSSKEMWEYQVGALVDSGCRVVTYDRRGFGKSSKPFSGYDYDTFADDLHAILEGLDLHDATLVGFSMGGGEVVRYFSRHGGQRVARAALVSAITPYMLKTEDNPDGVDASEFEKIMSSIKDDRIQFLDDFAKNFFGITVMNKPVSPPFLDYFRMLAAVASPKATIECVKAFGYTDFREEMPSINVPTLIIHGDSDKIVPSKPTSERAAKSIPDNKLIIYEGAPHGLFVTERERLNRDLIQFIRESVSTSVY